MTKQGIYLFQRDTIYNNDGVWTCLFKRDMYSLESLWRSVIEVRIHRIYIIDLQEYSNDEARNLFVQTKCVRTVWKIYGYDEYWKLKLIEFISLTYKSIRMTKQGIHLFKRDTIYNDDGVWICLFKRDMYSLESLWRSVIEVRIHRIYIIDLLEYSNDEARNLFVCWNEICTYGLKSSWRWWILEAWICLFKQNETYTVWKVYDDDDYPKVRTHGIYIIDLWKHSNRYIVKLLHPKWPNLL